LTWKRFLVVENSSLPALLDPQESRQPGPLRCFELREIRNNTLGGCGWRCVEAACDVVEGLFVGKGQYFG